MRGEAFEKQATERFTTEARRHGENQGGGVYVHESLELLDDVGKSELVEVTPEDEVVQKLLESIDGGGDQDVPIPLVSSEEVGTVPVEVVELDEGLLERALEGMVESSLVDGVVPSEDSSRLSE